MAERPGFLGGLRWTDSTELRRAFGSHPATATVDSVRGTLGPATAPDDEIWPAPRTPAEGKFVDVELLGTGFHFGDQIHTGRFDRLSGWINIRSGFVQVHDAVTIVDEPEEPTVDMTPLDPSDG
jgi:hypothetical protein